MESVISRVSEMIWSLFLPIIILLSIYLVIKFFSKVHKQTTIKSNTTIKDIVGPVAISLGAMVGTGAIIGVLGSIASLHIAGQNYFESIVGWAVIGALILLPIAYIETLVAKTTNLSPKQYIAKFLSPKIATIYAVSFALMYILGFGGFICTGGVAV